MSINNEWVELCKTNSDYEAHLIIGLLKANDIYAEIKSYKVSQLPFDIGHIGEIKIMVLESELEDAKRLIEGAYSSNENECSDSNNGSIE